MNFTCRLGRLASIKSISGNQSPTTRKVSVTLNNGDVAHTPSGRSSVSREELAEDGPQGEDEEQVERSSDEADEAEELETEGGGQADREGDRVRREKDPSLDEPAKAIKRLASV